MIKLNGREVIEIQIDGVDSKDYPDFCDAYICSACYMDTGEELSDDELDELTDQERELVNELAYEYYM